MSRPGRERMSAPRGEDGARDAAMGRGATVLVVAADERIAESLLRLLRALGWSPVRADSVEAALVVSEKYLPALAVTHVDGPSIRMVEQLRDFSPLLPLIAILDRAVPASVAAAYEAGACVCLTGPPTEAALRDGLRRATAWASRLADERRESMRLVESARAINASLLFSDIYPLTLDTLLRETGSQAAIGVFAGPDRGGFGVRALRGLPEEEAGHVAEALIPLLEGRLAGQVTPLDETADPEMRDAVTGALKEQRDGPPRILLVPVPRLSRPSADSAGARNAGAVLLLRPRRESAFGPDLRDRAAFLAAQAGIAFQNGALYAAAEERAYLDPLTGLYNTRYLYATLEQEISRSARYGHELSVLFLDLDRFKEVNDRHNHLVGSAVLVETAHLIDRKIRQVDSAVRYGGDEFTMILVETSHAGALHVAERIRTTVAEHVFQEADGLSIRLTCSIGVSTFPAHGVQPRALIEASDLAMYRAKIERDRVCSAS